MAFRRVVAPLLNRPAERLVKDDVSGVTATARDLRAWLDALNEPVLRSLTAHAPDAIFVLDLDARIQFINWTAGGLTVEGVIGTEVYGYVPPEQRAAMSECFKTVRRTQKPGSYQNVYTNPVNGSVSFWESRVAPIIQHGDVVGFVVISSDVTERRDAAAQRELLFSVSLDMLCIAGFDGFFKRINPAWCKTLQYSTQELLSRPWVDFLHPDDVARSATAGQTLMEGRDVIDFENRYRRKDGQYRTLSWCATGDPITKMIFAVARDVTEQRALEQQLRQSQKMDAVGQLAGGLAHDFNNLLLAILVNTEMVSAQLGPQHVLAGHLADIARASERASDLVKQLLAFGRRRPSRMEPLELGPILTNLSVIVRRLIPANVEVSLAAGPAGTFVNADPAQVEQVLLNLCLNARDAMLSGGRLTLETEVVNLSKQSADHALIAAPRRYAVISVGDTGTGMSPAVRDRIFEPFFTTKEPGKGTGLGLATVYAIVTQHGGAVQVQTEEGKGSRFSVYLPICEPPQQTLAKEPGAPFRAGHGTILVAEDEELVRSAVTSILESAGYLVLAASNGEDALAILEARDDVDLVLLDVVMPRLGGAETLARIAERWPKIKVVLSSAYRQRYDNLPQGTVVLEKPYRADDLLRRLNEELSIE
ncbi:MAG TPA: PAS domain S-box protein [Polyangiaceae bacterium]|nr:PAS domain S-box protein [Polyangiaceae bacterium]